MLLALAGGALIGLAASVLLVLNGRVAGISGIFAGTLVPDGPREWAWRAAFVLGLVVAGAALVRALPGAFPSASVGRAPLILAAGFLVGVGTRVANGCTSGHGVCGNARLSRRSIAATLTFMATGALTVFVLRHLVGGGS